MGKNVDLLNIGEFVISQASVRKGKSAIVVFAFDHISKRNNWLL